MTTYHQLIEAACSEACRDVAQVLIEAKEKRVPVQPAKIISTALKRLISYGIDGLVLVDCVDHLDKVVSDNNWKRLTTSHPTLK